MSAGVWQGSTVLSCSRGPQGLPGQFPPLPRPPPWFGVHLAAGKFLGLSAPCTEPED